jgi:hypothetical protein
VRAVRAPGHDTATPRFSMVARGGAGSSPCGRAQKGHSAPTRRAGAPPPMEAATVIVPTRSGACRRRAWRATLLCRPRCPRRSRAETRRFHLSAVGD